MEVSELTLNLGGLVVILGAVWKIITWLLQKNFNQFSNNLDTKFEGFSQQLLNVQSRLSSLEGVTLDIKRLELEIVKRDGQNIQSFVLRDEYKQHQIEQREMATKIFEYFDKITDKLDSKVSKADCTQSGNRRSGDGKIEQ